ncbi:hypothetical protein EDWATA_02911 [Edwardsiella tarda ATCC 23685]|uniref:Uncharacterized protein n=1 Tax=Edwardsiella tarda ATCC 23685 TaxID=500638 RepID=D4F824_EDWTA|nr:hypothetical protein EDWATA_02911 [Edwardsiella tarda ATCC 23685]
MNPIKHLVKTNSNQHKSLNQRLSPSGTSELVGPLLLTLLTISLTILEKKVSNH